jgi:cytochrome P450
MAAPERCPVTDWATDLDHTDAEYAAQAPQIWSQLREECPVAHSSRFGGMWIPTRHEDVSAIAHDTDHFSSRGVIVSVFEPDTPAPVGYAPPITSDPPFHEVARRLLLPAFSPKAIRPLEDPTRTFCGELLDELLEGSSPGDTVDAAVQYAQHIPVRVIAHMLGVPPSDGDRFRTFIHRILETGGQNGPVAPEDTLTYYLIQRIEQRRDDPSDEDLIGYLLQAEIDGQPLSDDHIIGTVALLLIAGIDTTWSAIGATLWHLAQHPEHRRRLVAEPELLPIAIEEFLRAYAPVTMARKVAKDVEVGGRTMREGEWVLLPFPAANRDPAAFEDAEQVVLDRERNRHAAFGLGIHRCLGSNLARMELTVAVREWLRRIPEFELAEPDAVRWSTGQVRGPRELPLRLGATDAARQV